MPYRSCHRYARMSARKARLVIDTIRGLPVDEALTQLQFNKRRAAVFIDKVLRSAIANAEMQEADIRDLIITEVRVDEGPTIKRFQPKDRGRAHPILKRTCHIHVAVDEGL